MKPVACVVAVLIADLLSSPLSGETKPAAHRENHCLSETLKSLSDLEDSSVKLDDGSYTTKGKSVIMSERCLQALMDVQKKDHKKRDPNNEMSYFVTELPDRFRIRVMPWGPERGHWSGSGGTVYDVAKENGAVTWYGGWR